MSDAFRAPAEVIFISSTAVDKASRTMQIPVGGLKENTDFYFQLTHWSGCTGDPLATGQYKTGPAAITPKKVLLVVDKQYATDSKVNQALAVYQADAIRADQSLVFERYDLSIDPADKGKLYEHIKKLYFDSAAPLHYLFFIGRNAPTYLRSYLLDPITNQEVPNGVSHLSSLGVYAKILTQDYPFDKQENVFLNRRYGCQYLEIGTDPILDNMASTYSQSSAFDVSYGAVIPTRDEEAKEYILRYFDKLHRYKTGQLKFDRKVLFADTFRYDGSFPQKVEELTGRWKNNDTIHVAQKYGSEYHADDEAWRTDYLKKLSSNSYEIVYYMGHGTPHQHYFGIGTAQINDLEKLNTLLFDFNSCSVGAADTQDYLAGTYLNKGNTLFVKAYSVPIGITSYETDSPLLDAFKEKQTFNELAKGAYVSDAYRYSFDCNSSQYLLGDPLLLLDPPQCSNTEPLAISTTGSFSLCPGDTTTLTLPTNLTDYRWFRNEQEINGATGSSLAITQSGFYTAKAKQCGQEASTSQGVTVTAKPGPEKPVLTVDLLPDRFRLRVTPTGKFSDFSWFINNERWRETTQDTVTAFLLGDYTVRVSQDGCSAVSNPASVRIEQPVLIVTGTNPACEGDSLVVKAPENFSSYTWLTPNGSSVTTTGNTRVYRQNASVAVIPKRGNLAGPASAYVTLTFRAKPPKPTVTLDSEGFRSSSLTGNQWYRNGQPLPDSTRQVLRSPGAGTYYVRVTQQGCSSDSDPMLITAIEPAIGSIKVYPNPGKGTFWIEWPTGFRSGRLEILDNLGRAVFSRSYSGPPLALTPVSLKTAPGLYLLRFSTTEQSQTVKLLVEN
ncbi:hypothetical protein GCM10027347_35630 [Larkinella harenae]